MPFELPLAQIILGYPISLLNTLFQSHLCLPDFESLGVAFAVASAETSVQTWVHLAEESCQGTLAVDQPGELSLPVEYRYLRPEFPFLHLAKLGSHYTEDSEICFATT